MLWSDQDPVFDKANFWVCFSLIASGFEILKSQNPVSSLGRYSQMFGPNCILHNFHSWFSYFNVNWDFFLYIANHTEMKNVL